MNIENDVTLALSKEERDYLLKHQIITVYNEDDWAPYNYNKNNTAQGFSIDYMNLLANKLNIKIEYIGKYSWSEILNEIKNEKIDVVSNIEKNTKREKYINFTTPYIKSHKAIFSNIENIKSLEDLDGRTVSLSEQSDIQDYLEEKYPNIKIKIYKNMKDSLYAVINKEADAVIENYAVVNSLMKRNGLNIPFVTLNDDPQLTSKLSIGVRKSQVLLRDILEKAKNSVSEDEFIKLEQKWFGAKENNKELFTQEEIDYIKNKKIVKMCAPADAFPVVIFNKEENSGTSIEFLKHITNKSNLKFEIVRSTSVQEHLKMIKDGVCDVAPFIITKPNVHEFLTPTNPIISDTIVLVTKIKEPFENDLNNLDNKKIAIQINLSQYKVNRSRGR